MIGAFFESSRVRPGETERTHPGRGLAEMTLRPTAIVSCGATWNMSVKVRRTNKQKGKHMINRIKTSMTGLLGQVIKAEDGANAQAGILVRITAAVLLAARVAAETASALHKAALKSLAEKRAMLEGRIVQARVLLALFRDLLKPAFGNEFNPNWEGTGWDGTLKIPKDPVELVVRLNAAAKFLETNPAFEVPISNITAPSVQLQADELRDSIAVVNQQETLVGQLLMNRDTKFGVVRKALRDLLKELSSALDPLDPRWKSFGLNMPGAQHIPDVPINVIVAVREGNSVALTWAASARAEYYRVFKRVVGVDEDFVPVSSQSGLDAVIADLPANAQIELAVSAVNNGGESARSAIVTVTT
jgi:hypothetical protein